MPRTKTIKRPKWKTANGPSTLKKMHLDIVKGSRKENQRIADFLVANGFEFWDTACIADYEWDFEGYTITFRKQVGERIVWFSWHWVNEQSFYWTADLRCSLNLMPGDKFYHPYLHNEVSGITEQTLAHVPTYANFVLRGVEAVAPWVHLTPRLP